MGSCHALIQPSIPASGQSLGWIESSARTVPGDKFIFQALGLKVERACALSGRESAATGASKG